MEFQPEYIAILFPIIILPTVISIFLYLFHKKNTKADIEGSKNALYSTTASGVIGLLRYNGPFLRVSLYESFMVISYFKKIILNYTDIKEITFKKRLLIWVLIIKHNNPNQPKNIQLFFSRQHPILEILSQKIPSLDLQQMYL